MLMFWIILVLPGMAVSAAPSFGSALIFAATQTVITGQTFNLNVNMSGVTHVYA
jgi:hypothetical protein